MKQKKRDGKAGNVKKEMQEKQTGRKKQENNHQKIEKKKTCKMEIGEAEI